MAETRALPLKRLTLPSGAGVALWLAGPASPGGVPEHLWKGLSADEKDKANRFLRGEDRALFALTRGMLRCLLSNATGVAADKIAFAEGPYGKPCLAGTHGPHFNVSHSGCWALIGFSDSRPVGVDIEFMRAAGGELDLARSFFSAAEYRSLEGLANGMLLRSFYKIWTCKEALLKAHGAGISEHLKDFSVELTEDGYAIHPEPNCFSSSLASVAVQPVEVPEGYAGCYALA
ncbi:MAG: 4'-phosphopantetheinyl transferase superfamily protein [Pseudomonadota bacterium]|nr:4'-phosphopantetheinyl transferase superfamily protein [Pseudomonadota bacterium]